MKLLTLPRLRLGQLQTVGETTLTISKNLAELAAARRDVQSALIPFKEGMVKDAASAEQKRELDLKRDHRVSGFFSAVLAERKFPNVDKAVLKSHADLLKIVNKYGKNIIRLSRDEETSAIDNLLADINQIDVAPLATTGITRWLPAIEAANKEYKVAAKTYISDSVEADAIKAASILAPALEDALEKLFTRLFATIMLSPTDALKKAYAELETLVESMR